jgi:hypothetical protein
MPPQALSEANMPGFIESREQAARPLHDATFPSLTTAERSIARKGSGLINIILKDG